MGVTEENDEVIGGVLLIMLSMSAVMVDEITSISDDRSRTVGVWGGADSYAMGAASTNGFLFNVKIPFFGEAVSKSGQGIGGGSNVVEDGLVPVEPGAP